MGGGKGKTKPRSIEVKDEIDGTTWLAAHREGRIWGKPHQWRLDELFRIKMELYAFFACPERGQGPRKIFRQIKKERKRIAESFYSIPLQEEMEREVNGKEISLYQLLLPSEVYSAVTSSLPLCGPDRASQHAVAKECLEKLRQAFSTLPDKGKKLATPIGKKLATGSRREKGESLKSSDIVGAYILNVYELFRPFYPISTRGYNKKRSEKAQSIGGKFPFALIKTMVKFFREEFSPWLKDLTEQDVISRIQYGPKRRVQRKINPPPKGRKRPHVVMRTTLSKMERTLPLSQAFQRLGS